jgi:RimJ/RimL family protein N-acetyltransferase
MSDSNASPWQPTVDGPTLRVRPLAAADLEPLYVEANDPDLWAQHPEPTRWQRPVFEAFFASALACGTAVVAEERATGRLVACSRYYDIDPATRSVAIGYTFVTRSHWGGATNGELKALMLAHAFGHADTVWLHIGRDNWRSRKAAEKIGAVLDREGERAQGAAMVPYCWYRLDRPRHPEA